MTATLIRTVALLLGIAAIVLGMTAKEFRNEATSRAIPQWLGRTVFILVGLVLVAAGIVSTAGN
jgi:di/tricarboxylate transporter